MAKHPFVNKQLQRLAAKWADLRSTGVHVRRFSDAGVHEKGAFTGAISQKTGRM